MLSAITCNGAFRRHCHEALSKGLELHALQPLLQLGESRKPSRICDKYPSMLITQVFIWRKCVQQLPHFPVRPVHHTLFYSMSSRDPPRNPQMRTRLHYILTTQLLTCVVEPSLWHASSHGCNMPLTIYYLLLQVRDQQVFDLCFCFSVKNQKANT